MSILKHAAAALLATTAVVAIASSAQAQTFKGKSAGDIMIRARALAVMPDEKADVKLSGSGAKIGEASVNNDYIPEVDFSYFVTDNIALELIAGTSRHKVKTSVPAALGSSVDVGKVSLLPPTLSAQYHFLPKSQISPYVGAGLNYTLFYRESAARTSNGAIAVTNTDYKNRFGFALQAGVDFFVNDNVAINLDVKKLFLRTKLNAEVNVVGTTTFVPVTSNVRLDPWIVGVGVGYKF